MILGGKNPYFLKHPLSITTHCFSPVKKTTWRFVTSTWRLYEVNGTWWHTKTLDMCKLDTIRNVGIILLMAEIRLTTWDVWNPINNGKNHQPQLVLAGFQPSTVSNLIYQPFTKFRETSSCQVLHVLCCLTIDDSQVNKNKMSSLGHENWNDLGLKRPWWQFVFAKATKTWQQIQRTVDGRNPAPPGTYKCCK